MLRLITISVLIILSSSCINSSLPPLCTNWTIVKPLCTLITTAHNFLNSVVPTLMNPSILFRHCNFLLATPHCCEQFCAPAKAATCEQSTGACRCQGVGVPSTCNMQFNDANNKTNPKLLEYCRKKCDEGENVCKTPSYVNDGINYLCVCYCS